MSEAGWFARAWRSVFGAAERPLDDAAGGRTIQVTLFIPSVDRDETPIDQRAWRRRAIEWLGSTFGGATAFPPGVGVWRDDQRGGELVFDKTVILFSYASEASIRANEANIREFMVQMGRETRQGSVAYVLGNQFFEIPIV